MVWYINLNCKDIVSEFIRSRTGKRVILGGALASLFTASTFLTHSGDDLTESATLVGRCLPGSKVEGVDVHYDGPLAPVISWPVVEYMCDDGLLATIFRKDSPGGPPIADTLFPNEFETTVDFIPQGPEDQTKVNPGFLYEDYDDTQIVGQNADIVSISVTQGGEEHQLWEGPS
jgi:hypothetical protein